MCLFLRLEKKVSKKSNKSRKTFKNVQFHKKRKSRFIKIGVNLLSLSNGRWKTWESRIQYDALYVQWNNIAKLKSKLVPKINCNKISFDLDQQSLYYILLPME